MTEKQPVVQIDKQTNKRTNKKFHKHQQNHDEEKNLTVDLCPLWLDLKSNKCHVSKNSKKLAQVKLFPFLFYVFN